MLKAMPSGKRNNVPLYVRIAETFTHQVANGALRSGDRVPSLRKLSKEQGVSLSTALQAYLWLENRGYLEARPQSGFYIRTPFAKLIPEPQAESLIQRSGICPLRRGMRKRRAVSDPQAESDRARNSAQAALT
jgi:DNA-binding transcriptional MocR family regulator